MRAPAISLIKDVLEGNVASLLAFILIVCGWTANAGPANLPPIEFSDSSVKWDSASQQIVQTALDLAPSGKFERVLDLLRQHGLQKIIFVKNSGGEVASTARAGDTAVIELADAFFNSKLKYGKVSQQTHVLIHELIHVYVHFTVGNSYYESPFWMNLKSALEWNYPASLNSLVSAKERGWNVKRRNELESVGQYGRAVVADLDYARQLGFPSLYSMSEMKEYVCELVAFLAHDPKMAPALPPTVTNWLLQTEFAFLLDSQKPAPETGKMAARRADVEGQFDFVGLLYIEDRPTCTVTILRHGFIRMARHCLDAKWFVDEKSETKITFISVAFFPSKGRELRIEGSAMFVAGDAGENDLAYIRYPAELTSGAITLPTFELMTDPATPAAGALFTVGYPVPEKVQRLQRMVSAPCKVDGKSGTVPGYRGHLVGTTCPAWFGASGSLILSAGDKPNHFKVWGVLSHTFSVDANAKPLASAIKKDAWGVYTDSNFSPLSLSPVR